MTQATRSRDLSLSFACSHQHRRLIHRAAPVTQKALDVLQKLLAIFGRSILLHPSDRTQSTSFKKPRTRSKLAACVQA